ncbi:unnamed protein product [Closterium sp. Naga37s-1]|nr:unnamed protein product [Closterium sp. Naga37s-1]
MTLGIFPRLHCAIGLGIPGLRGVSSALGMVSRRREGAEPLKQEMERRLNALGMQIAAARSETQEAERERAVEWNELRRRVEEISARERAVSAAVVREREEGVRMKREVAELRERLAEAMGGGALEGRRRGEVVRESGGMRNGASSREVGEVQQEKDEIRAGHTTVAPRGQGERHEFRVGLNAVEGAGQEEEERERERHCWRHSVGSAAAAMRL